MPTYDIRGPDGKTYTVRANTPEDAINGLKAHVKPTVLQNVSGALTQFNKMIPLADEIAAAGTIPGDLISGRSNLSNAWQNAREQQQSLDQGFNENHPNIAALSRGAGVAASAALPLGTTAAGGSLLKGAAQGAVLAGNQSALSAFTDKGTLSERLKGASQASVDPVTLGLGAVLGGAGNMPQRPGKAISSDALQDMKSRAYQDVENSGARYSQEAYDQFVDDLNASAKAQRLSRRVAPKASSVLNDINKLESRNPSLGDLEEIRRVINRDVSSSKDQSEQFFGSLFKDKLDDLVENTQASQMLGGDSQEAASTVGKARALNARYRKTKAVEDAIKESGYRSAVSGTGGNVDNVMRQQVRAVMKKTKNLTPDETAAFDRVIKGSPGQDLLRMVGRLSPQNGLMGTIGIGGAMVNPMLGIPMLVGGVAKGASDAITKSHVDNLLRTVSNNPHIKSPEVAALRRLLTTKLIQSQASARGHKQDNQ